MSLLARTHLLRRLVEHVYLTYAGGTPLVHLSRSPSSTMDPDLIASMFTVVQNFMDDSFRSMGIGDVRSIEMGKGHHVAFGRGRWVLLYIVYRGRESNRIERRVNDVVQEIEGRFASVLQDWNGEMNRIAILRDYLERVWSVPGMAPTSEDPESPPERHGLA